MEVSREKKNGVEVVKAVGRIDSNTAPKLREVMDSILDEGKFRIIFDMSEVEYLSSSGVWVLLETQKACRKWNRGGLVIVAPSDNIDYTLDLAGLKHFIEIYPDLDAAISQLA
jgi:anti-sigma B factor antagonist